MGKDEAIAFLREHIDEGALRNRRGGLGTWDAGEKTFAPWDLDEYLEGFYHTIVDQDSKSLAAEDLYPNLSREVSQRRQIILKKGSSKAVLESLGSGDTMLQAMLAQMERRSDLIATMTMFGTSYRKNFNEILDFNKIHPEKPPEGGPFSATRHALDVAGARAMFRELTGDMDTPVSVDLARKATAMMQWSNLVNLFGAGISATVDAANLAMNMNYNGMPVKFFGKSYWSAWEKSIKAYKHRGPAMEFAMMHAAGMTAALHHTSARIAVSASAASPSSKLHSANQWLFSFNMLNAVTTIGQATYVDLYTRHLGGMIKAGEFTPAYLEVAATYGITEAELRSIPKELVQHFPGMEGERINISGLADGPLRSKLMLAMEDQMNTGIIIPDAGSRVIARGGLQAGTLPGSIARVSLQYSTLLLAVQKKIITRFSNGYEKGFWEMDTARNTRPYLAAISWAASAMAMGYVATVMKDILKGREPIFLDNILDKDNLVRVMDQSGATGVVAPILSSIGEGDPVKGGLLSPNIRAIGKAGKAAASLDLGAGVRTLQENLPGGKYLPAHDGTRAILGLAFGDALGLMMESNNRITAAALDHHFQQDAYLLNTFSK
jgi:hypothetical protein